MENLNNQTLLIVTLIGAFVSLLGMITTIFDRITKNKPEKKKLGAETDSEIADAAESIATGAKMSNEMLMNEIKRMQEREEIREARYTQREEQYIEIQKRLDGLERELALWKDYSYRLTHQVRSLGHDPVPFEIPTRPPLQS